MAVFRVLMANIRRYLTEKRGKQAVIAPQWRGARFNQRLPRHMADPVISTRRDIMAETAERLGIEFVEVAAPDPMEGFPGTQQFITEDVPRQVAAFGQDTAFFGTSCSMQVPLITQVVETGAIFPEQCCPKAGHGFPAALEVDDRVGVVYGEEDRFGNREILDWGRRLVHEELIPAIRTEIAARGATGRLATWSVSESTAYTAVGAEYAIEWLNGNVPREHGVIDMDVLNRIFEEHILEITGEHLGVELHPFSHDDRSWRNYVLVVMDSIVF